MPYGAPSPRGGGLQNQDRSSVSERRPFGRRITERCPGPADVASSHCFTPRTLTRVAWPPEIGMVIHHMAPLNICKAGNTLVPAYLVLRAKGYHVTSELAAGGDELWIASGPLGRFMAEDTESLLGLVTLAEVRGEQWRASDEEIDNFMATFGMTGVG
jgi:hypothetical protein